MSQVLLQVVGFANSGKTTLIGKIIDSLKAKYTISVIKSARNHRKLEEEKDSYQHLKRSVCVSTAVFSDMVEFSIKKNHSLTDILNIHNTICNSDVIIIEGFKKEHYPKILLWSKEVDQSLSKFNLDNLITCYLMNPEQNGELDGQYDQFLKKTNLPGSKDFEELMTHIKNKINKGDRGNDG